MRRCNRFEGPGHPDRLIRHGQSSLVAWLAASTIAFGACTIVVRDPGPGVEVEPLRAHMLWAVSVDRSAVNLAPEYETIIREFMIALAAQPRPVVVEKIALVPLDRTFGSGPRLIYAEDVNVPRIDGLPWSNDDDSASGGDRDGGSGEAHDVGASRQGMEPPDEEWPIDGGVIDPGPIDWNGRDGSIALAISAAAASSLFDTFPPGTPEHVSLASVGASLGSQLVLDVFSGNPEGRPFFDDPPDVLIVGTLGHLRRSCAIDDLNCRLEQLAPDAYFAASDELGASWLRYGGAQRMAPESIFHVSFVTAEGRNEESFYRECSGIAGFPQALVDSMEPSPVPYYVPFSERLSSRLPGRAIHSDLCLLLGSTRTARLVLHALHISSSAPEVD